MIAAFLSKSIFKSFRDRELEENEELQTFPLDWALELVEPPVLLTIFGDQQLEEFEKKNLETCREQENESKKSFKQFCGNKSLQSLQPINLVRLIFSMIILDKNIFGQISFDKIP